MHLYETHIPVTNSKASETFYCEVVGLPFAYRDPTRDIVFLWVDERRKGMIGLWGASTGYGRQSGILTRCHLAFAVSFEHLKRAIGKLHESGIETSGFGGKPTTEPSVIGWMHRHKFIFATLMGIRSNSLRFYQGLRTPVL